MRSPVTASRRKPSEVRVMGSRHGQPQEFTIQQSCPAVEVPWGTSVTLMAGKPGTVTQRLGGTITVMVEGNLYRLEEQYAEALGLEPLVLPDVAELFTDKAPTPELIEM